jgi:hypothetical protein
LLNLRKNPVFRGLPKIYAYRQEKIERNGMWEEGGRKQETNKAKKLTKVWKERNRENYGRKERRKDRIVAMEEGLIGRKETLPYRWLIISFMFD